MKIAALLVLVLAQFQDYNPQNADDLRRCEDAGYSLYQCGTGDGLPANPTGNELSETLLEIQRRQEAEHNYDRHLEEMKARERRYPSFSELLPPLD